MLTNQLFSAVAEQQVKVMYSAPGGSADGNRRYSTFSNGGGGDVDGHRRNSTFSNDSSGDARGLPHLAPTGVPLIDWARMLEEEPDMPLDADPVSDLLSQWMQRKCGQDSVPHRLLLDVREARLSAAQHAEKG
jgi:hypothetical protein